MVTCGLRAALIFGKKPEPRGKGEREGERGKEAAPGESRARRTFWKQTARETERKSACQGGRAKARSKW
jgi:hypothetical protein